MAKTPHDNRSFLVRQLILGSTSPFRRQLLASTGLSFITASPTVDEASIQARPGAGGPSGLAQARAAAKALAVARLHPEALVIGADQVLGLDERALDKVGSAAAAQQCLRELSGRTHHLYSAVTLAYEDRIVSEFVVAVAMPMRALSPDELNAYVATGEWQGCVGCYQYEQRGVHLFAGVHGDQSAIVGLPRQELCAALRGLGLDGLAQPRPPWTLVGPTC